MPERAAPGVAGNRIPAPAVFTRSAVIAVLLGTALGLAVPALLTAAADGYRRTLGHGARPDDAIQLVAASGALLLVLWLSLGTLVSLVAHVPGRFGAIARAASRRCAPALVRQLVAAAISGAVLAGAAPAHAAPPLLGTGASIDDPGPSGTDPTSRSGLLPDPGWVPRAPARVASGNPTPAAWVSGGDTSPGPPTHVVASGECLWDIAREQLPPGASTARIDARWRHWYAANRDAIGPDPDLLHPGQHLVPPAPKEHR